MDWIGDMETILFFQFFRLKTDARFEEGFVLFWRVFILLHETIFIPHWFEEIVAGERLHFAIVFFLLTKER